MIASDELLERVRSRGFTVVPDALARDSVPRLRERLEQLAEEDLRLWTERPYPGLEGAPYPDGWMVHNPFTRSPEFAALLENEAMHAYLSPLLGATCTLYAYTTSSMPPGGTNLSARVHVDSPRWIPDYPTNVGVIFPLDDFTDDNGATYFLPRSHLSPDAPTEAEFFAGAERVYPRAGDMVVFNARTYHFGGTNRTGRARHAITLNVCRSYMKQRFDYPRLTPKEVVDALGPVGRRFLGFDTRVPASLAEYFVPPERRLYKPNQG
ncbi:MAG: phytanoyl-CoA dioxygenase family protein [Polyangiaceae bacterium]|nr:phytanoyl-CoA dioxygenase family protein [Polyangiaceae bacterium]